MEAVLGSLGQILLFVFSLITALAIIDLYVGLHLYFHNSRPKLVITVLASSLLFLIFIIGYKYHTDVRYMQLVYPLAIFIAVESGLVLASKMLKGKYIFPILLVLPAYLGMIVLILYPICFEVYLSFFNLNLFTLKTWLLEGRLDYVGIRNYLNVFYHSPLTEATFWDLFLRTILWTFVNVFFHVLGGIVVALCLSKVRLKSIYRTLIIIPWAMPQVSLY